MLSLKFAKKILKIENFRHSFHKNTKEHEMRTRKSGFYKVSKSYGTRYLKSAIPSMQSIWYLSPTNFALLFYMIRGFPQSSEQLDVSIYISFPFRHGYLGLFLF